MSLNTINKLTMSLFLKRFCVFEVKSFNNCFSYQCKFVNCGSLALPSNRTKANNPIVTNDGNQKCKIKLLAKPDVIFIDSEEKSSFNKKILHSNNITVRRRNPSQPQQVCNEVELQSAGRFGIHMTEQSKHQH